MPKVWDSSTVMTPSLPTLSMASAIIPPISVSAAEMDATWAICSLDSVSRAMALEDGDGGLDGGLDAPLQRHRVGPGGHVAQALADHGPGQHGGGGGAVTGDVVGLLGDLLHQLGADPLVGVLEVDLLGDGDAVVGDRRGAPLLLQNHVAALGAERDAYGVDQLVHAALEGPAGLLVEGDQLGHGVVSSVGDSPVSSAGPGTTLPASTPGDLALYGSSANSKPRAGPGRRRPPGQSAPGLDGTSSGSPTAPGERGTAGRRLSRRRRPGRSRRSGRRPPGCRGPRGNGCPRRPRTR